VSSPQNASRQLRRRWKGACGDQFRAQLNPIRRVECKNNNGGAATGSATDDDRSLEAEMARPALSAGIEKPHDSTRPGINPRQVRPLVVVVVVAGQGQIICIIATMMLPGDNVFDV
jgi:hypothetical protein